MPRGHSNSLSHEIITRVQPSPGNWEKEDPFCEDIEIRAMPIVVLGIGIEGSSVVKLVEIHGNLPGTSLSAIA